MDCLFFISQHVITVAVTVILVLVLALGLLIFLHECIHHHVSPCAHGKTALGGFITLILETCVWPI